MSEQLNKKLVDFSEAVATSIYTLNADLKTQIAQSIANATSDYTSKIQELKSELLNAIEESIDEALANVASTYLPLAGGTILDGGKVYGTSTYADNATNAENAVNATYATNAEFATMDASGNNIVGTYATKTEDQKKLPLAGGTMSGVIVTQNETLCVKNDDTKRLILRGGTSYDSGASLYLHGMSYGTVPGGFELMARDGSNQKTLMGYPDGTLTWGGTKVPVIGFGSTSPLIRRATGTPSASVGKDGDIWLQYMS